jgi:hypothetical protein
MDKGRQRSVSPLLPGSSKFDSLHSDDGMVINGGEKLGLLYAANQ